MKKTIYSLAVFSCLALGTTFTYAHSDGDHMNSQDAHHMKAGAKEKLKLKLEDRFSAIDTNGDGAISKEEFDAVQTKRFTETDANQDGKITPEEIKAKMKDWKEKKDQ